MVDAHTVPSPALIGRQIWGYSAFKWPPGRPLDFTSPSILLYGSHIDNQPTMRSNAVLTIHDAIARLFSTLHRRPAGHQMVMNAARANQSLKPPPTPTPTPMRSSSFTPARRTITTNMVFQRTLCTSPHLQKKQMPRRPVLDENDVTGSYLKGSGPGGQKIVSVFFSINFNCTKIEGCIGGGGREGVVGCKNV